MKLSKKFALSALALSSILLVGCSSTLPNNSLQFNPSSPTATAAFSTLNQQAVVNVVTKDERQKPEISAYNINGNLFKLYAKPAVEQLFQQVMQQDLNAKGFRLSQSGANTQVFVTVNDFYAKAEEGNFRHKISSKIQLQVHVQGIKGNFTKNLGATRTDEDVGGVDNADVQKALSLTLQDVVTSLYNDHEIATAISNLAN